MTPCKNGHTTGRYSNGNCKQCLLDREKAKRDDPNFILDKLKRETDRYWSNRDKKLAYDKEYRIKNRDEILKRRRARYVSEVDTERKARRRTRQTQATPKWASPILIRTIYREARLLTKETGVQMSVDHIVPIFGKTVCGLHCPDNLRVIPMIENASKSHLWWPDMFESE